jgi:hypothetical protein
MRSIGAIVITLLATPSLVHGQQPTYHPPRFEVGGAGGFYASVLEAGAGRGLVNVWTTANLTSRFGIELGVDAWKLSDGQAGAYYVRGKVSLPNRPAFFVTFGGGGLFELQPTRERRFVNLDQSTVIFPAYTYRRLTRPILGMAGVGFSHVLGRHVAMRLDVQFVAGIDRDALMAVRTSGGVSIPIGAYK